MEAVLSVSRCLTELDYGKTCEAVLLLPFLPSTRWWLDLVLPRAQVVEIPVHRLCPAGYVIVYFNRRARDADDLPCVAWVDLRKFDESLKLSHH